MPLVVDPISDGGLGRAVVDRECRHSNAAAVQHNAVLVEVTTNQIDLRLVGARRNIGCISFGKVGCQLPGSDWAYDLQRLGASSPREREPARQPQIRQSDRVVRMEVSQKDGGDIAALDAG